MRQLAFILACMWCSMAAMAQDSTLQLKPVGTFGNGTIKDVAIDNLGSMYLVMNNNQVKKLNSRGDSIAVYNDIRRFGDIYSIDVTNPLKVLIYFRDFATVVVLDRLLSIRNTIDLRRQNILQTKAIATSYDNNIWVYDELDSKLKKMDDNGNVVFESTDFRQVFDPVPSPQWLSDRDGMLYVYDPRQGLLVFDYYGAKKNNLQLLNYKDVQVQSSNSIVARDSAHIVVYKPATMQFYSFRLFNDMQPYLKIIFTGSRVFCLNDKGMVEAYEVVK